MPRVKLNGILSAKTPRSRVYFSWWLKHYDSKSEGHGYDSHLKGYSTQGLVVGSDVKVNRRLVVSSRRSAAVQTCGGKRQRTKL